MSEYLLVNGQLVNEGKIVQQDILIRDSGIDKIGNNLSAANATIIDLNGQFIFPGVIDDQVHFREPGLTHKGDLYSESKAAVAGGITSFMEMPNTIPNTLTQELLEAKYQLAASRSFANFSFFMGVSNDNYEEVMRTNGKNVCGIKIFMGASTGNMLVDNENTLNKIFAETELLIATHCEYEPIIKENLQRAKEKYGEEIPIWMHPVIRNEDACFMSSLHAITLAKKYKTRLHILHISTAKELQHFTNTVPLKEKRITAEACIHHLWYCDEDYPRLGNFIKWNPAIKSANDRDQILQAVLDNRIDVIATDHAPHTLEEKQNKYINAPAGGPLVQHALPAILDFYHDGKITLTKIAEKMSHAVADCFNITDRGYIREGYFADLAIVDLKKSFTVTKENILAKCGWSPFEGHTFRSSVTNTFVSGKHTYSNGKFKEEHRGMRLTFNR